MLQSGKISANETLDLSSQATGQYLIRLQGSNGGRTLSRILHR
jgi:hypothetical protein